VTEDKPPLPEVGDPEYINHLVVGKAATQSMLSRWGICNPDDVNVTDNNNVMELRTKKGTHVNKSVTERHSGTVGALQGALGDNLLKMGVFNAPRGRPSGVTGQVSSAQAAREAGFRLGKTHHPESRIPEKPKPKPVVKKPTTSPAPTASPTHWPNCPWFAVGKPVEFKVSKKKGWKPATITSIDFVKKVARFQVEGVSREMRKPFVLIKVSGPKQNVRPVGNGN